MISSGSRAARSTSSTRPPRISAKGCASVANASAAAWICRLRGSNEPGRSSMQFGGVTSEVLEPGLRGNESQASCSESSSNHDPKPRGKRDCSHVTGPIDRPVEPAAPESLKNEFRLKGADNPDGSGPGDHTKVSPQTARVHDGQRKTVKRSI